MAEAKQQQADSGAVLEEAEKFRSQMAERQKGGTHKEEEGARPAQRRMRHAGTRAIANRPVPSDVVLKGRCITRNGAVPSWINPAARSLG